MGIGHHVRRAKALKEKELDESLGIQKAGNDPETATNRPGTDPEMATAYSAKQERLGRLKLERLKSGKRGLTSLAGKQRIWDGKQWCWCRRK
jgi:hypothetical protein